jgi:hypothetical protein
MADEFGVIDGVHSPANRQPGEPPNDSPIRLSLTGPRSCGRAASAMWGKPFRWLGLGIFEAIVIGFESGLEFYRAGALCKRCATRSRMTAALSKIVSIKETSNPA